MILLISILLLGSCNERVNNKNNETEKFVNDIALDSFFTSLHKKGMFNGSVAVKKEGELIFKEAYGTANFTMDTPFSTETAMEIASLSKQFTAAAILILKQEKKLNINNNIQEYLGENFPYPNIRIKHLLTHSSGLRDYEDYFKKKWDTSEIAYNKDILAYFKNIKPDLISQPGEKYHYSNSGYILLAEIVRVVSGEELDAFLKKKLFDPVNMSSSNFYGRDDIWTLKDYAPGYRINPATCDYVKPETLPGKSYYHFLSGRLGSGRLSTSLEDLITWDAILYTDEILNKKSKELAFQAYPTEEEKDANYGFGWHVIQNDSLGKIVYHTGSWAGNLAYIKRYLDNKSLVIILNNTSSPYMKEIRSKVEDYLEGKPLKIPDLKGTEILKKEICTLNKNTIGEWYQSKSNISWDIEDLEKFSKQYDKVGEHQKKELIEMIIEFLNSNKA